MIFDFFSLGLFLYYFNVAAITGIMFFMLAIMYQRSKRIIINTAEQPYKPDNSMLKLVLNTGIVIMIWLFVREYGIESYVSQFLDWTSDLIIEVWNG